MTMGSIRTRNASVKRTILRMGGRLVGCAVWCMTNPFSNTQHGPRVASGPLRSCFFMVKQLLRNYCDQSGDSAGTRHHEIAGRSRMAGSRVLHSTSLNESPAPLVAIVDDEEHLRITVSRALRGKGIRTAVFSPDGAQAWQSFSEEECPDLAILDIIMPRMDGLELCRRIRAFSENGAGHVPHVAGRGVRQGSRPGARRGRLSVQAIFSA